MHMVAPQCIPENFYERQRITLLTGTEVVRIDAGRRIARLADGRDLPYSRCLLATGGRARELPGLPRAARPACITSARWTTPPRCAQASRPQARVAVIGGGFLAWKWRPPRARWALKSASWKARRACWNACCPRPCRTGWPNASATPAWTCAWARALPAATASRTRTPPSGTRRAFITLQDAATVAADIVVVAIGLTPEVSLAVQAGLALDPANGGIAVNAASPQQRSPSVRRRRLRQPASLPPRHGAAAGILAERQ